MEHGLDFIYEAIAVLFFLLSVTLIFNIFDNLHKIELQAKRNLYEQHVLYVNSAYE